MPSSQSDWHVAPDYPVRWRAMFPSDSRLRYQPVDGGIPRCPCSDHGRVPAFLLSVRSPRFFFFPQHVKELFFPKWAAGNRTRNGLTNGNFNKVPFPPPTLRPACLCRYNGLCPLPVVALVEQVPFVVGDFFFLVAVVVVIPVRETAHDFLSHGWPVTF